MEPSPFDVNQELEEQERFRDAMDPIIPDNFDKLRCCKICGLIKSEGQFESHKCENCRRMMEYDKDFYSAKFSGMTALLRPDRSYISKVKGMREDYVVGLYATSCEGTVPPEIERLAAENGVQILCSSH
ncbi:transcription elongation factor SPT4, putative [Entamoeba invadens IP1]|uniref:Transcription elongation factor SPT4, putative n=1 Tax=Entamoeba invadens IP1 TaxID=370355 RepID=A0A0A1UAQ2_ENTIV|nr:transcription elongation factor SPT4, putative [Entamoeba invadens IP1]ELP92158.1 transcription elongation factor SPT4, putative [Entamoeba invadens IP1]|eukprot:XP_004258929.1 transcription elongation factor SPT4, putative [Entamoeba invadens IP1]